MGNVTVSGGARLAKDQKRQVFIAWTPYIRRPESMQRYFGYDLYFLPLPFHRRALKPLGYLINSLKTLRIFVRDRPDIVWIQLAPSVLLYVAYLYKVINRSARIVADCHNSMFNPLWLNLPFAQYFLERCQIVLVHNDNVMAHAEKQGIAGGKLVKLETRPAQVQCNSDEEGSGYERPWVLFPCSFDRDEPVDVVFKAATLIPDVIVTVTGNTSRAAGRHDLSNLPPNIRLTGFLPREKFNELLCSADLLLGLTTSNDVQLSVANEAVGAEKPMVISDTKLLRSLFYKGTVYVETMNADSIALGIRSALDKLSVLTSEVRQLKKEREARWSAQAEYVHDCLSGKKQAV